MSVGDVLVQYDLHYAMYDTPDPRRLALDFAIDPARPERPGRLRCAPPQRLDGPPCGRVGRWRSRPRHPEAAPLVTYTVDHPRPVVRAESLEAAPLMVAGNSSGLVNASSVGLLAGNPTIFYSGTLDTQTALR